MKDSAILFYLLISLIAAWPASAQRAPGRGVSRKNIARKTYLKPRRAVAAPSDQNAPAPQAGALIRTAGIPTIIGPSSPQVFHEIEAGKGMIAADPARLLAIDTNPGVRMGKPDKAPGAAGSASGNSGVTVRQDQ